MCFSTKNSIKTWWSKERNQRQFPFLNYFRRWQFSFFRVLTFWIVVHGHTISWWSIALVFQREGSRKLPLSRKFFGCFREQPCLGQTHNECDKPCPRLISLLRLTQEVGEKRGRLYEPKAGSYSEASVDNTTHTKGMKMASSARVHSSPCPSSLWQWLTLLPKGWKPSTTLLRGRLCSHMHTGDAGRAVLQLPQVARCTFRGGKECQEKEAWEPQTETNFSTL